jgi:4-amino-4-deoxy-L-arabinose transferase-like glycosyltransferase
VRAARRLPVFNVLAIRRVSLDGAPRIRFRIALLEYPILLLWSLFLFGYGISAGTLYRTEALRAIIGREALHGAWLTPTLYGEPFLTKPPGMYVAIAAASAPFGEVTTVSARIPSALAATITVFLFLAAFRRVVERRLALAGAMLMPVSLLWLEKAPSAEIDMLQLMWVSAALLCFLRALEEEESATGPLVWWLLALFCVTGGFLTKWTAPAFFYLTVVPMLVWQQRLGLLFGWRHLLAVGLAVGLCALWASAVSRQLGWETLRDTILAEASQRLHPHHNGKPYPWRESLLHPFAVLAANLPWSLLALYALRPSFFQLWDENGRRLLQLLHCWTWPNLIFWSLPAQHHVRYSLPMCPGIVGLGVMVGLAWARGLVQLPLKPMTPKSAFVGILIAFSALKIAFIEVIVPERAATHHVRATAARLEALVPAGELLYLCKLKDEGVMFYYGRPVRRLSPPFPLREAGPGGMGSGAYVALIAQEWDQLKDTGRFEVVDWLRDQQGDPIVLVRCR